jgi:hypothetical protein
MWGARVARIVVVGAFACMIGVGLARPAAAQSQPDPVYPTVAALDNTPIPARDRVDLARRLRGVTEIAPPPAVPAPYALGDVVTFSVTDTDNQRTFEVEAELIAVSEHLALWAEVGAGLNINSVNNLTAEFDATIYDGVRDLWGSEATPGVDGDPRVHGLFVAGVGATTAAYFSSDNVYPIEAVPQSNEREMFVFNLDAIGTHTDGTDTLSTVAHEFQHMIRNNLQTNEETWLNEGFSLFTEFYLYRREPWEAYYFLSAPDTQLNNWSEASFARSANYGASTLFMVYFYQRYGIDAVRALSADDHPRGLSAFAAVLAQIDPETSVDELFADWVAANGINAPSDPIYGYTEFPSSIGTTFAARSSARAFEIVAEAYPYGTDYYRAPDGMTLDITLVTPRTEAQLIADRRQEDGSFWYSNRADMSDTTLTREFDLTGVQAAALEYDLWLHTEDLWDYGYVMVSADAGASWNILSTRRTTDDDPHGTAYGAGYTGSTRGWVRETVSLDAYAGEKILVRFEMITDDAINQPGMAIDNVRIEAIDYTEDFETGGGDWEAAGWIRTDNRLPLDVWVQAMWTLDGVPTVVRWLHEADSAPMGQSTWQVTIPDGADDAVIAISPFAPVTTNPIPYTLTWSGTAS